MAGVPELLLVGLAGVGAGVVNALAGGGSLISFPTLVAVGVPAIAANVTNTVALCPGYLGATLAQARDLRGQTARIRRFVPASVLGGLGGGVLLLQTTEAAFRAVVPYLILLAAGLLALQEPLRAWIRRRGGRAAAAAPGAGLPNDGVTSGGAGIADAASVGSAAEKWASVPVALAAIYGGYFGAGLSVIVLAVLALLLNDTLTRLNALKQSLALSTNVAAAIFFICSGRIEWPAALVLAAGAGIGGVLGGRLAGRIRPGILRAVVVVVGIVVGVAYLRR